MIINNFIMQKYREGEAMIKFLSRFCRILTFSQQADLPYQKNYAVNVSNDYGSVWKPID